ncbi:MAG: PEGA domain-containing protein [Myxococcota bacterium]|nr:PEGA domain-containing protein [Myxococcota bacterium]
MRSSFRTPVCMVALLVIAPRGAVAQAPNADVEAGRLFQQGVAAIERDDYASALVAFRRAYDLAPRPKILFNIAMCHQALSQLPEALAAFRRFLTESGPDDPPEMRVRAERAIAELEGSLGRVAIAVDREGARILLDGSDVAISPLRDPLDVGPGAHVLEARLEGFRDARATFDIMAGESTTVELHLEPVAAPLLPRGSTVPPEGNGIAGVPGPIAPENQLGDAQPVAVQPEESPPDEDDEGVLSSWWFWTVVGVVAAGGATTAAVLLWPADEEAIDWSIAGR